MLVGILSFIFGASEANGQVTKHVSKAAFQSNLSRQMAMSPLTVAQLREHGVTTESELKLEYFFHTNSSMKAQALASALRTMNYSAKLGPSAGGESVLATVTGWTKPILMEAENVVNWTIEMTRLGYEHDCEFDGWGTNPSQ